MSPLVSIVIPCYNAARFIQKTLESVFSQSFSNYELIIINDGSTDASGDIVKALNHPVVKYVDQTNQGVSAARNKGLSQAKGKYVLFLDADDLLEKDFLKLRVELLETNPTLLFCYSEVVTINEEGAETGKILQAVGRSIDEEICTYKANYCSCPSNYLIRREKITGLLEFNPSLSNSADRFFLLRLNRLGKGLSVSGEGRLKYRVHAGSMSKTILPKNIRDLILFYGEVLHHRLVPSEYYWALKLKTFRICFSESLLIQQLSLTFRTVFFVLLKF